MTLQQIKDRIGQANADVYDAIEDSAFRAEFELDMMAVSAHFDLNCLCDLYLEEVGSLL